MFADVASRRITAAPGVLIKRNVSFLSKFLYSSVRFLLSVDDSPIVPQTIKSIWNDLKN